MKKLRRMLNLILALVIFLSTVLPVMCNLSTVFAESYTIQYNRKGNIW